MVTRPAPKPAPTVHALRNLGPLDGALYALCGLRYIDHGDHTATLTPSRVTCERCRKAMGVA